MALANLFIRTKREFAGISLDAVLTESFSSPITVTKNPVEFGANIADHAIIQPKKYTLTGVVSNTPLSLTGAVGQIIDNISGLFGDSSGSNLSRSQSAYEALQAIKDEREPIEVQTGLGHLQLIKVSSNLNLQLQAKGRVLPQAYLDYKDILCHRLYR